MSETHVGVIGNVTVLTPVQRSKLAYALASIALGASGRLVLHHGCGEGADEIAHQMVRLLGGWQIHGHPAQAGSGSSHHGQRAVTAMEDLDVGHGLKPPAERDADIVKASTVLIIAGPFQGDPIHAAKLGIGEANRAAEKAIKEIFYLHPSAVQRGPSSRKGGAKHAAIRAPATADVKDIAQKGGVKRATTRSAATAGAKDVSQKDRAKLTGAHTTAAGGVKDVAWATLQGQKDRKAGTQCPNYKGFLKRYNLWKSEKTWEMWEKYYRHSGPTKTRRKSPSPPKRTRPPQKSALSEDRLARVRNLQRKLNPPEAIRDAWR